MSLFQRVEIAGRRPDPRLLVTGAFGLPLIWGTAPDLPGRTLSVARAAAIPALYAEYGGGGELDPSGVQAYVSGCLNVLRELDMLDGAPQPPAVEAR